MGFFKSVKNRTQLKSRLGGTANVSYFVLLVNYPNKPGTTILKLLSPSFHDNNPNKPGITIFQTHTFFLAILVPTASFPSPPNNLRRFPGTIKLSALMRRSKQHKNKTVCKLSNLFSFHFFFFWLSKLYSGAHASKLYWHNDPHRRNTLHCCFVCMFYLQRKYVACFGGRYVSEIWENPGPTWPQ